MNWWQKPAQVPYEKEVEERLFKVILGAIVNEIKHDTWRRGENEVAVRVCSSEIATALARCASIFLAIDRTKQKDTLKLIRDLPVPRSEAMDMLKHLILGGPRP